MTDLVTRGQLIILARILHKEPEDLAHLEYLGAQNLNQIQERMANLIYDQHQETFTRMARLIPLIPLTIWMPLVRRMVPANLTGRAAGPIATMHPKKAADVIKILGPEYGADVARYLDPRALPLLAAAADPVIVTGVVNEVLRRRDYVTVGPMLGYASQGLIESVERYVPDDEGLVRAAAYAYSAESVSRVLRQLLRGGQNRVPGMMRTVLQGPEDLQLATLSLIARCDTEPVAEMSEIIIEVGSRQELCDLVITAIRGQSVRELTVFFGKMSQKAQQVIAALPIFTDNSVVAALLRGLEETNEPAPWHGLFAVLGTTHRTRWPGLAHVIALQSDAVITTLPSRATEASLWTTLLDIVAAGDHRAQSRIASVWSKLPPERQAVVQRHLEERKDRAQLSIIADAVATSALSVEEMFFRRRRQARRRFATTDTREL